MLDNATSKNRIDWVDMLKGLAILLIVIGHFCPGGNVERYIYTAHVFCFFAVSGFLFTPHTRCSLAFLKKKATRLLVPYAFWSVGSVLYMGIAQHDWQKAFVSILMLDGNVGWNAPLWFLPVIFLTEVLFCFVNEKHRCAKYLLLAISPWVWYACKGHLLPLKLDAVPPALFFFTLGYLLKSVLWEDTYRRYITKASVVLLPLFAFLQVYFGVYHNRRIAFTKALYGNYLYCLIAGIGGVLFFFFLFYVLPTWRPLAAIGKSSLFIMCSHYWVMLLADTASKAWFHYDLWHDENPVKAVIAGIAVVLVLQGLVGGVKALCRQYPRITRLARAFGMAV